MQTKAAIVAVLIVLSATLLLLRRPPVWLHGLSVQLHRMSIKITSYALIPKMKIGETHHR